MQKSIYGKDTVITYPKIKKEGKGYLETFLKEEGVKKTKSGLAYKILKAGSGNFPKPTDVVEVHYHGTLIDGTVFDSSRQRGAPATFPVTGVIEGWTEALQLMNEGSHWRLFIPPELAYGDRGAGGGRIPPNSVLIFDIELLEVK